jgi:hypothetical protein
MMRRYVAKGDDDRMANMAEGMGKRREGEENTLTCCFAQSTKVELVIG